MFQYYSRPGPHQTTANNSVTAEAEISVLPASRSIHAERLNSEKTYAGIQHFFYKAIVSLNDCLTFQWSKPFEKKKMGNKTE